MCEDEAFIRAIVADPADDAPRLIYADWLDEHEDARGTYLRVENQWAKSRSEADQADLSKIGMQLDPTWVARVSRTPMGVCCEHIRFSESGPSLTWEAGCRIVDDAALPMLPEYLAFLLNYNGGIPDPKYYPRRGRHGVEVDFPERFFSLLPVSDPFCPVDMRHFADPDSHGRTLFDVKFAAYSFQFGDGRLQGKLSFLPLSQVPILGMLAIGTVGVRRRKVYQFNRYTINQSQPPILVAKSLPDFLHSIRPIDSFVLNGDFYQSP